MIYDKTISFRFLHKEDGQPLRYERVCTKDEKVVPWEDIVKGYEVRKGQFIVFDKKELESALPESNRKIRIDKFVDYLSIDPVYFDRSYLLGPDESAEAYGLLLTTLEKMAKAGAGRITLRTKEYPVLLRPWKGALILTTLIHANEVVEPSLEELKNLKEPSKAELDLAKKIVADLSGEFDITEYQDGYKEKIEVLIEKKMKGEPIMAEKPAKEEAKELMVALQETLKQLKKK
jgi:DNA end-binding protein Ku